MSSHADPIATRTAYLVYVDYTAINAKYPGSEVGAHDDPQFEGLVTYWDVHVEDDDPDIEPFQGPPFDDLQAAVDWARGLAGMVLVRPEWDQGHRYLANTGAQDTWPRID